MAKVTRPGVGGVQHIIAVAAGKGGVGKSTVAAGIACALAKSGKQVGLLDADLYGSSLLQMIGDAPLKLASVPMLGVRAPIANQVIGKLIRETRWGDLNFLIVDFPPGTGDIQLTLCQQLNFAGAVLVTTPQQVALADVERARSLFDKVGVPILGTVENMSYFEAAGQRLYPFGQGKGGDLGEIPLVTDLAEACDRGQVASQTHIFEPLAQRVAALATEPLLLERVEKKGGDGLSFSWRDGTSSDFKAIELQRRCPCAKCRGEGDVEPEVEITRVESVGRYGLRFLYTSGCCEGIYSFGMLR